MCSVCLWRQRLPPRWECGCGSGLEARTSNFEPTLEWRQSFDLQRLQVQEASRQPRATISGEDLTVDVGGLV